MTTPSTPQPRAHLHRGKMLLALATALLLTACGGSSESASQDPPAEPSVTTETTASSEAPVAAGCPDLGQPTESYDPAGTPLAFGFRHPKGFAVSKQNKMDSLYQLDLRRPVEVDGQQRQVYFSVIQSLRKSDSEIPMEIRVAREQPDNPRIKAMAELMPKPAGEVDFGGQTVELFRVDTESKTVYKFHVPHGGGYYSVSVEFAPSVAAYECLDQMRRVAGEWVKTLTPNPAVEL